MKARIVLLASAMLIAAPALSEPVDPSAVKDPSDIIVTAPTPLSDVGEGALAYPAQTVSDEQIVRGQANHPTD